MSAFSLSLPINSNGRLDDSGPTLQSAPVAVIAGNENASSDIASMIAAVAALQGSQQGLPITAVNDGVLSTPGVPVNGALGAAGGAGSSSLLLYLAIGGLLLWLVLKKKAL